MFRVVDVKGKLSGLVVVHVDDVLLFGPDEKKMKEVLNKLELQKFDFKLDHQDDPIGPNQEVPGSHRHV